LLISRVPKSGSGCSTEHEVAVIGAYMVVFILFTALNKKVTANFFSQKIFSDKVKKGLKFFFNLRGRACRA